MCKISHFQKETDSKHSEHSHVILIRNMQYMCECLRLSNPLITPMHSSKNQNTKFHSLSAVKLISIWIRFSIEKHSYHCHSSNYWLPIGCILMIFPIEVNVHTKYNQFNWNVDNKYRSLFHLLKISNKRLGFIYLLLLFKIWSSSSPHWLFRFW